MTANMAAPVRPEHQDSVVPLTIDHPGARDPLSSAMRAAIAGALNDAGSFDTTCQTEART